MIAAFRYSSWSCATRSHWSTTATRMTTYPPTMTPVSRLPPSSMEEKTAGRPIATTRTPAIWTMVRTRKSQSSLSNAEANQVKLIHAQTTAIMLTTKPMTAADACPEVMPCASSLPATPNAATKVRSYSSSRGDADRSFSKISRAVTGRSP